MENYDPIHVFDLLNISDEELKEYEVRLNQTGSWFNVVDQYYFDKEYLLDWAFTRKWPNKKAVGQLHAHKVLQFIQLDPDNREKWLFIGAFEVGEIKNHKAGDTEIYNRNEIERLKPYDARLVVKYKKRPGDTQFINNLAKDNIRQRFIDTMTVEKISESPVSAKPFPGFHNVRLSFEELKAAINNEEWQGALKGIKAVYLQTDKRTGYHYVGSAYAENSADKGLLHRWEEYVDGDHTGGNKQLKKLVANQPEGKKYIEDNFQYSILDIFDSKTSDQQVIDREHWWMETLSSIYNENDECPHGYNTGSDDNEI
ncbi:GIY-YIG nuclease family protein [Bifidobacterium sp. ESL0728]|uniref:GIY-YIG nuclease family protein n=1 Tax=Bifidobacterium sp. ESL0728 TaxID=2983220 RepID=UPI0023F820B2|nr:GIY-YIG nuclease family protein [Bifidobacterium sp. ESL0728]WEV59641.1 GIY-YIG nuclease family protein [Bifidobacterium sp. ESL0728]